MYIRLVKMYMNTFEPGIFKLICIYRNNICLCCGFKGVWVLFVALISCSADVEVFLQHEKSELGVTIHFV